MQIRPYQLPEAFPHYAFDKNGDLRYTHQDPGEGNGKHWNGVMIMTKWALPEKLTFTGNPRIKLPFNILLLLLAGFALGIVLFFNNLTGPVQKEQTADFTLNGVNPAVQVEQEAGPAFAGEGEVVSRGGAVSRSDVVLLAQVIEAEAAGEPYSGKVAVGAVIINRTKSPNFPRTIPGVIYERDAFESVSNGQYLQPVTTEALQAATEAVGGADPAGGALYFWNPSHSSSEWVYTRNITTRIGDHVFAR